MPRMCPKYVVFDQSQPISTALKKAMVSTGSEGRMGKRSTLKGFSFPSGPGSIPTASIERVSKTVSAGLGHPFFFPFSLCRPSEHVFWGLLTSASGWG